MNNYVQVCVCVGMIKGGVRDKGFQRARAQWLPCPYTGSRAGRIPLTEPKRDWSCWESEEVRVVSLNQVGDRMGRKRRKSCCSISRYSDLSCPAPPFFMLA